MGRSNEHIEELSPVQLCMSYQVLESDLASNSGSITSAGLWDLKEVSLFL